MTTLLSDAKLPSTAFNTNYLLLDSGNGKKLENVGGYRLIRPAAGAVWAPSLDASAWQNVDAEFIRKSDGDGNWKVYRKMPDEWHTGIGTLQMLTRRTDFGHLGLFAEHSRTWPKIATMLEAHKQRYGTCKVLNLFAYTGGSTLAAAQCGSEVVHIDASKTSVAWARQNATLNNLGEHPIRYIVEDVRKFAQREIRRGSRYDAIILDPPSYGRGANGEIWKIEDQLQPLLAELRQLCSDHFRFMLLSAHSQGYTPHALTNILKQTFSTLHGDYQADEMLIEAQSPSFSLPSGSYCCFSRTLP